MNSQFIFNFSIKIKEGWIEELLKNNAFYDCEMIYDGYQSYQAFMKILGKKFIFFYKLINYNLIK